MNKYLKEMGKMAGIDGTEMQVKTNGGRRYEVTVPKYELISTHTARRSFATNAFKAGVPSISIMRITGHSTEKAFMKYIKITNEDNARLLSNHRFFNPG
jgi:integrase